MKKIAIILLALAAAGTAWAGRIPANSQFPSGKYVPGMLIIKLKPELRGTYPALSKAAPRAALGIPGLDGLSAKHGITRIEPAIYDPNIGANKLAIKHGLDLMYVVYFDAKSDVKAVWRDYQASPAVAAASPNGIREYCYTPNDPQIGSQWHIAKTQCPQAWDVTRGDSTVVLAIVDSGCDWTHVDLSGNSWVNAAEDINGNGAFDNTPVGSGGDLDGIDNDGNGLVDDVVGWDFTDGDNNPYPDGDPNDHGTHCNGCAAATTDNGIGVAGPGFKCERISFRCTAGGGGIGIVAAINAMYYAVQKRATVISLSWGGYAWYPEEQDIVNYAGDNGTVIVAAAGNDGVADPHYPSALPGVIAVCASNSGDGVTWSNYGAWVDIASPGEGILSTTPNNTYQTWDGTSMATPIVAGVVGLIRAAHPGWTSDQIVSQLLNTADNIDAFNPTRIGKIGSGRVNAYRAVTTVPSPRLTYADHSFVETTGNGNGRIEAGETVALTVQVKNLWGDALAVNGELSSSDEFIAVTSSTSGYGSIEGSIYGGQTRGNNTAFALSVGANAPYRAVQLSLHLTATGYDTTITFNLNLGRAGLLLVNDGEGYPGWPYDPDTQPESFGDRLIEKYYTSSLDTQGYSYDIWRVTRQQGPSLAKLKQYGNVMWVTEWTSPSLDTANIDTLSAYLSQGGGLFISGQDLGWEADYYQEYLLPFYTDYVHAQYGGDAAESFGAAGVAADPIGDSISFNFWQPFFSSSFQYADYFTPITGATAAIGYNGSGGQIAMSKYAGAYRLVYLPIGLESVNNNQSGSVTYDATRSKLAGRIVRWLQGNIRIGHDRLGDVEDVDQDITVAATVASDTALNPGRLKVYWMRKSLGVFSVANLLPVSGDDYSATIPAFHASDSVFYYLYAEDASGRSAMLPVQGPGRMNSFYVGPDVIPPVISFTALPDTMDLTGPYPVSISVTDNMGVDTSRVMMHYYLEGEADDSVGLDRAGGSTFTGQIVPAAPGMLGQRMFYRYTARDVSLGQNLAETPLQSFVLKDSLYLDAFNSLSTARWDTGIGWQLTTSFTPHSLPYCMKSQPSLNIRPNWDNSLMLKAGYNLSPYTGVALQFWHRRSLDTDTDIQDTCYVYASADTGNSWTQLAWYTGTAAWAMIQLPLDSASSFCWGPEAQFITFKFQLKVDSEPDTVNRFGWFIDDIKLKATGPYFGVSGEPAAAIVPARLSLSPAHPNPMSGRTTLVMQLPTRQRVSVDVYNVLGQRVRTLCDAVLPPGAHSVTWDGTDEKGRPASNGVYLYQLRAGAAKLTRKVVVIR